MGRSRSFNLPGLSMVVGLCLGGPMVSAMGRAAVSRIVARRTHRAWLDTMLGLWFEQREYCGFSLVYNLSPLEP